MKNQKQYNLAFNEFYKDPCNQVYLPISLL